MDDLDPAAVDLRRLGGTVKVAEVFAELPKLDCTRVAEFLLEKFADQTGKLNWGASLSGGRPGDLKTLLIGVKKALKAAERSARFVNKNFQNLSSATVELEGLTRKGAEILAVRAGPKWFFARTLAVQPFESYKKRDYEKAVRDARVGMLPPKLAQIMLNLAQSQPGAVVYDPFCGTGTVLVEAALLGYKIIGSDLDPRMVAAAQENLAAMKLQGEVFQNDAARAVATRVLPAASNLVVVTEGYLGPPLKKVPEPKTQEHIFRELAELYSRFFRWIRAERVVLTLPVYCEGGLPRAWSSEVILQAIEQAGWRVMVMQQQTHGSQQALSQQLSARQRLLYARPDQTVGREIVHLVPASLK